MRSRVVAKFGVVSALLGACVACCATVFPRYTTAFEVTGGILLVVGLAAIGSQLVFCCR